MLRSSGFRSGARLVLLALLPLAAWAQSFFTYIGQIESRSVLIAWGSTARTGNTIGRASTSQGKARVQIAGRAAETQENWIVIPNLTPDTNYTYELFINDQKKGEGKLRTYPEHATKMCFFVIGDFGTGQAQQFQIGDAMWKEYQRRSSSDCPVRFVLTLGDNIYADVSFGGANARSGDADAHWETKFFRPYQPLLQEIPFYPTLGNHDGNGTENRGDLDVYLDNFFFPGNKPARWYTFTFADLAQFFALDSTTNTEQGGPRPAYSEDGEQSHWLQQVLPASKLPWKIPYFHHPIYNAGPRHPPSYNDLRHWVELFQRSGVRVVFSGHEHNFQFTQANQATGNIRYVISGAGGELRTGDVKRKMDKQNMAGWAAQRHFLVVEIENKNMTITPLSYEAMRVVDSRGNAVQMPLNVSVP